VSGLGLAWSCLAIGLGDRAVAKADAACGRLPPSLRFILGLRRMSLPGLHSLEEVLALERPEILRDKANFWARVAVLRVPVPIVLTSVRSRAMRLLYLLSEWRLSRRSDRVLTNSEGMRRELTRWARVDASKIHVSTSPCSTSRRCSTSASGWS
jgi:hypothetical protein